MDIKELDPNKTVVVATGNAHKVTEIEAILAPEMPGVRFVALGELGDYPDPVEDGETFFDNALIKARAAQAETGLPMAVADDSGLCVDALGGAPGIFSARWAGEHGNDLANNEKLMAQMADVPQEARTARFHSSIALVRGNEVLVGADGRGAGGKAEHAVGLELDLGRDDVCGLAAHVVIVLGAKNPHDASLLSRRAPPPCGRPAAANVTATTRARPPKHYGRHRRVEAPARPRRPGTQAPDTP